MENPRQRLLSKRKRVRHMEKSFVMDGNSKTFVPPAYEPLLDRHLQLFFVNENRLQILRQNKLINRRYELTNAQNMRKSRPKSGVHSVSLEFKHPLLESPSIGICNKHAKALSNLERPVLTGYDKERRRNIRNKQKSLEMKAMARAEEISNRRFTDFIENQRKLL